MNRLSWAITRNGKEKERSNTDANVLKPEAVAAVLPACTKVLQVLCKAADLVKRGTFPVPDWLDSTWMAFKREGLWMNTNDDRIQEASLCLIIQVRTTNRRILFKGPPPQVRLHLFQPVLCKIYLQPLQTLEDGTSGHPWWTRRTTAFWTQQIAPPVPLP